MPSAGHADSSHPTLTGRSDYQSGRFFAGGPLPLFRKSFYNHPPSRVTRLPNPHVTMQEKGSSNEPGFPGEKLVSVPDSTTEPIQGARHGNDQRSLDRARLHGANAFQRLGAGGQVLQAAACGRSCTRCLGSRRKTPSAFADNWGWKNAATDWEQLVRSPEIGLVDVVTPNYMHAPVARAAIAAGKPCSCEKPIAGSLADARAMVEAAKAAKVKTFVWFNYRRCPAVALAHQLVKAGKLGRLYHVRATYLQDWAGRVGAPAVAVR